MTSERAETVALSALAFIAGDEDMLARFIALTGVSPVNLREMAGQADFLSGVLDFMMGDEDLVVRFAASEGIPPGHVAIARSVLSRDQPDW